MTATSLYVLNHVLPVSAALLPPKCDKIDGADERCKRPAAPHHNHADRSRDGMANQKSSTLTVRGRSSNGTPLFERRCACGDVALVDRRRVNTPCFACAMKARRTHGLAAGGVLHPLYKRLHGAMIRCTYPSASNYAYYGGRGIRVCAEWSENPATFVAWAESNGWRPGLELDRIDPNGDYAPSNCQFVTHRANSQRTRRIVTTTEQAKSVRSLLSRGLSIKAAAFEAGVTYMVAWHIKNSPGVWRE